jgi:hypothetical protein
MLMMQEHYLDDEEAQRVENLLGIRPEKTFLADGSAVTAIEFTSVRDFAARIRHKGANARVPVKLTSFFEILFDLSNHVDIPAEVQMKQIARTITPLTARCGIPGGLYKAIILIRNSSMHPDDAYVAIGYRGGWFFISDSALMSKDYLMLVRSVFSLLSGDIQTMTPLLTLPVAR